jgi:hypothetical protein
MVRLNHCVAFHQRFLSSLPASNPTPTAESNSVSFSPLDALAAARALVERAPGNSIETDGQWTLTLSATASVQLAVVHNRKPTISICYASVTEQQEQMARAICQYQYGQGIAFAACHAS